MSDPSLLVTNPTRSDPSLAPDGKPQLMKLQVPGLTSFGEDPDGRLFAVSQTGKVLQFEAG